MGREREREREREPAVGALLSQMKMSITGNCHNCHQTCKLLRCSNCQIAQYCSRSCQRKHWRTHKLVCLPVDHSKPLPTSTNKSKVVTNSAPTTTKTAISEEKDKLKIQMELLKSINQMSIQEAHSKYLYAQDEIKKFQLL